MNTDVTNGANKRHVEIGLGCDLLLWYFLSMLTPFVSFIGPIIEIIYQCLTSSIAQCTKYKL